jgi:hypothetical protein
MGDSDDGSVGVTAIRGADGVRCGEREGGGEDEDEDGPRLGRMSLNGEGDPNGEGDGGNDVPFIETTGLPLLLSPSAMSTRGRCGDASRTAASSSLCSSLPVRA